MVSSWYIHVCYSCPTIFLKELNGIPVSCSPVWFYLCSQLRKKVKLGWGNKDTEDYLLHSRSFLNPALRIPHGISNSEHHWHCIVHHPAKFVNIYIIYTIVMVILFNVIIICGSIASAAMTNFGSYFLFGVLEGIGYNLLFIYYNGFIIILHTIMEHNDNKFTVFKNKHTDFENPIQDSWSKSANKDNSK